MINARKITSAIAAGTLIFNSLTSSVFAVSTLEISGNGSFSDNQISVNKQVNTTVVQTNDAYVKNDVDSKASTGGNDANDNTGGDVTIATGNATSKTDLSTQVNLNHADIDNCNCNQDTDALISGNGSESDNQVNLNSNNNTSVFQDNKAKVKNYVDANASTGKNDANRNTGGDVTVITGHANTEVDIANKANANVALVGTGGSSGGNGTGTSSARIIGNGSFSDNQINMNKHRSISVVQANDAYIKNYVDAHASTGKNDANDNTDGDVVIDTGNATTRVGVDNLANFNAVSVDCGCLNNLLVKELGNGSYSTNKIYVDSSEDLTNFQDNRAGLKNYIDSLAKTGKNDANRNTGGVSASLSDPAIITGHAVSEDEVRNSANVNWAGAGAALDIPELHFDFNLGDVLGSLHLM